jgi:hypothetical protein
VHVRSRAVSASPGCGVTTEERLRRDK